MPIILRVDLAANQVVTELLGALPFRASTPRQSFERALIRDYPGMTTLLLRHTRNRQLAADLLQDAIVTTLAKLDAGTASPTPEIAGYVFRTAMNHLRNHRRHERLRAGDGTVADETASDSASPEEQSQREANARAVRQVLNGLASWRDREVLVRFYLREQSKQEICTALGLGDLDFNRVIFRARERMRRQLEGAGMGRADLLSLLTLVSLLAHVR